MVAIILTNNHTDNRNRIHRVLKNNIDNEQVDTIRT